MGPGSGEGGTPPRVVGAGGPQQPGERGPARLPHKLVDRWGKGEFPAPEEAVQELRHEGLEPMGADAAAGLPQDLGHGGHRGAVGARAATGPGCRPEPRDATKQPDRRLAVDAGHGHDFVQQPMLLGSSRPLVPLALLGRVLPQARSGHRHLLGGFGNPDF